MSALPLSARRRSGLKPRERWSGRDWIYLCAAAVAILGPLFFVARLSTRPVTEFQASPNGLGGSFTLENFRAALTDDGLGDALLSSATVVLVGAPIATALAAMTGFALAKLYVPFKRAVVAVMVGCMLIPPVSLAIPTFDIALTLRLVDSKLVVGVIYGVLFAAWGTLMMRAFFASLPDELLESAILDGASMLGAFTRIALPLALPALGTVLLFNVLIQWSELILALLLLTSPDHQTVSVVIANFASNQYLTGGPTIAAAMMIVSLPIVVLFIVTQRWLRADVLSGAVKG